MTDFPITHELCRLLRHGIGSGQVRSGYGSKHLTLYQLCRFGLDERSPEQLSWTGLVFAGEELDSGGDELVQAELTVVVGVDRLERVAGHLRIESDDVEEQLELLLLDHAVGVGVDGPEKQRQRAGQRLTQRRVLHLFLEGGDELVLVERLAAGAVLQVLLPELQVLLPNLQRATLIEQAVWEAATY